MKIIENSTKIVKNVFLEVRNEKYSQMLYLIDYVAPGPYTPSRGSTSPQAATPPGCGTPNTSVQVPPMVRGQVVLDTHRMYIIIHIACYTSFLSHFLDFLDFSMFLQQFRLS